MNNKTWLVLLTFGPVQSFISAARKTRDLWYGSYILSEIARESAIFILEEKHKLVLPNLNIANLPKVGIPVSNKITFVLENKTNGEVAEFVKEIKKIAKDRLIKFGKECINEINKIDPQCIDNNIFDAQINDGLECYSSWVAFNLNGNNENKIKSFKEANERAQQLLAGRKALRDFSQNSGSPNQGILKSSLNPGLLSVFKRDNPKQVTFRSKYQIDKNEELDALSLIKRVLGKSRPFKAVARIALHPWLEKLSDCILEDLKKHYKIICEQEPKIGSKFNEEDKFPYDCEYLIRSRIEVAKLELKKLKEDGTQDEKYKDFSDALNKISDIIKNQDIPDDSLYIALLQADGDYMGELLNKAENIEEQQLISSALIKFTEEARKIIKKYNGACIYTGGDDVLGLLPVANAIECAKKLAEIFSATINNNCNLSQDNSTSSKPSLSVGIAYQHVLEPLNTLRENAKFAERIAKNQRSENTPRNGLALNIQPRSGGSILVTGKWDNDKLFTGDKVQDTFKNFSTRMEEWISYFENDLLSKSTPYDMLNLTNYLNGKALMYEVNRIFLRRAKSSIDLRFVNISHAKSGIETLANEMLAARWLSKHSGEKNAPKPSLDNELST